MKVTQTGIPGLILIEPDIHGDTRGYFSEAFNEAEFDARVCPLVGRKVKFVQDNESLSGYGVVRGLHYQKAPYAQAKLVRCVVGRVLDIALDIREGSPTYGKHYAVELSEENHLQLFIDKGFAHAFVVLSPKALFQYKCDEFYHPEAEGGFNLFDSSLGIELPIPLEDALVSEKDTHHPNFK